MTPGWIQIPLASRFVKTVMCFFFFTKYGFHTGQAYSRTEVELKQAAVIAPGSLLGPKILLISPNIRRDLPCPQCIKLICFKRHATAVLSWLDCSSINCSTTVTSTTWFSDVEFSAVE